MPKIWPKTAQVLLVRQTPQGMLEVIESDFARLEATTKAAEEGADKEYSLFLF